MYKFLVISAVLGYTLGYPITQEELAQYVARQQTAGAGGGLGGRQPYLLQAQPRQVYQGHPQPQPQPQPQLVYQGQPQAPSHLQAQPQPQPQYIHQPQQLVQQIPKRVGPPPPRPHLAIKPGQEELAEQQPEDYDPNPQYQFAFDIKDDEFTNYQQRKEQREGDKISGSYSVVDADGYIRTVTYTADPQGGFKADVTRQPTDIKVKFPVHPQPPEQQLIPQQFGPQQGLVARKQQTQQYLQGATGGRPQYVQAYQPQPQPQPQQQPQQPRHLPIAAIPYAAQAIGATPKSVKAAAIGYAQQPTASPILYQAYQQ